MKAGTFKRMYYKDPPHGSFKHGPLLYAPERFQLLNANFLFSCALKYFHMSLLFSSMKGHHQPPSQGLVQLWVCQRVPSMQQHTQSPDSTRSVLVGWNKRGKSALCPDGAICTRKDRTWQVCLQSTAFLSTFAGHFNPFFLWLCLLFWVSL